MIGQLSPNTNEMLQCILAIQILDLNTATTGLGACSGLAAYSVGLHAFAAVNSLPNL
jgi:hypothetical protein